MTVKDIIKVQALLVGRQDVFDYLSGKTESPDTATIKAVDLMVNCVNLILSELACTYIPMTTTFTATDSEIVFANLPERILEIQSVKDKSGREKSYKFTPEKISGLNKGDVLIYSYLPSNYGLDEKIGYNETQISNRVLAYAVASEYLLTERAFDEAVMWRNRYVNELSDSIKVKNSKIKARRWY